MSVLSVADGVPLSAWFWANDLRRVWSVRGTSVWMPADRTMWPHRPSGDTCPSRKRHPGNRSPSIPEPGQPDPEEAVPPAQSWSLDGAAESRQLLAQGEDLGGQGGAGNEERAEESGIDGPRRASDALDSLSVRCYDKW